jgi:hypothetical protein
MRKAAKHLDVDESSVRAAVHAVKKKAAAHGYSPAHDMTKEVPEGFLVKGVSTNYDADGVIRQQWVKTDRDRAQLLEQLEGAVEAIIEPCRGVVERITQPKRLDKDLLTVVPVADPHVGMYAWAEESGADQSTELVVEWLNKAQGRLIAAAPDSETCLIANLGDYFHADTMENKTMRSGNVLDVDSRWAKVLRLGVQSYRDLIIMALAKHKKVIVKSVVGNHDDHSNVMLAMAMQLAFENNPRVDVHLPINPFQYHRFGNVLLGMVHDCKPSKLPGIMAEDMRSDWGECSYCHWMTAHQHSEAYWEFAGCSVERFGTIAAKDAWTNSKGYRSRRYMQNVVYHKDYGECERFRVGIESIA